MQPFWRRDPEVKGATEDPCILAARHRRSRAMLATLMLSQGVPMLLAGDEFEQTQGGGNNTGTVDSEISWLDWDRADKRLIEAVVALSAFRREVGLTDSCFAHDPGEGDGPEVSWHGPAGPMDEGDWGGDADFGLPEGYWRRRIDSACDPVVGDMIESGEVALGWRSVAVWQEVAG